MSIPETISDEECSICMSVLIKPVTLQCKHEMCLSCLCAILRHTTVCPICRFKLNPSLKRSKNLERHVNKKRWTEIQNRYPNRVNRKLNNVDTDSEENDLEFALCVSKLKNEHEQKLAGNQVEVEPANEKPKGKGTKRKRDDTSPAIPKVKVAKLSPPGRKRKMNQQTTHRIQSGAITVQAGLTEMQPGTIEEAIVVQPQSSAVQPKKWTIENAASKCSVN